MRSVPSAGDRPLPAPHIDGTLSTSVAADDGTVADAPTPEITAPRAPEPDDDGVARIVERLLGESAGARRQVRT